jgi:hypothetical protein
MWGRIKFCAALETPPLGRLIIGRRFPTCPTTLLISGASAHLLRVRFVQDATHRVAGNQEFLVGWDRIS